MSTRRPGTPVDADVHLPGSKSLTHRALIAAALAEGESAISGALSCEDTRLTARALERMGIGVSWYGEEIRILGKGGRIRPPTDGLPLDVGNSGTSLRLLLSVAALGRGAFTFTGSPRMHERPVGELAEPLRAMGAAVHCHGRPGYAPLTLHGGGIRGGSVHVRPKTSSQHLSSLLLAAPYARRNTDIRVSGRCVSRPYVDMTLRVMEAFGVRVERSGSGGFRVPAGAPYQAGRYTVEGDASTASYFWAAAAVTRGRVVTRNCFPRRSAQGDMRFLDILERMGCRVLRHPDRVEVIGGALRGVSVDMGDLPDMVPTLAAVALFARGRTVIRNVEHLRLKECDRLEAMTAELGRLGGRLKARDHGLLIEGAGRLQGARLDPRNDHRIAMSLAVVGLRVPGVRIQDPGCVGKSFPAFWSLWGRL